MTAPVIKTRHDQPVWVCLQCGRRLGQRPEGALMNTFRMGCCGVCGETKPVTEPGAFGDLRDGWDRGA